MQIAGTEGTDSAYVGSDLDEAALEAIAEDRAEGLHRREHAFHAYWMRCGERLGRFDHETITRLLASAPEFAMITEAVLVDAIEAGWIDTDTARRLQTARADGWGSTLRRHLEARCIAGSDLPWDQRLQALLALGADALAERLLADVPREQRMVAERLIRASGRPRRARSRLLQRLGT
jgi:hypothetical protein